MTSEAYRKAPKNTRVFAITSWVGWSFRCMTGGKCIYLRGQHELRLSLVARPASQVRTTVAQGSLRTSNSKVGSCRMPLLHFLPASGRSRPRDSGRSRAPMARPRLGMCHTDGFEREPERPAQPRYELDRQPYFGNLGLTLFLSNFGLFSFIASPHRACPETSKTLPGVVRMFACDPQQRLAAPVTS